MSFLQHTLRETSAHPLQVNHILKDHQDQDRGDTSRISGLLSTLFANNNKVTNKKDGTIVGNLDIASISRLLDDPNIEVRIALARIAVESNNIIPRSIVLALAEDVPVVAAIIARHSTQLTTAELVDIVATREESVQCAIAERLEVDPGVAAAIAEVGTSRAIMALISNKGANINTQSLARIVERFGDDSHMRSTIYAIFNLPIGVLQLLHRAEIAANHGIDSREIGFHSDASAKALEEVERSIIAMLIKIDKKSLPEFVDHLHSTNQLTSSIVLRAIIAWQIDFVFEVLVILTGTPKNKISIIWQQNNIIMWRAVLTKILFTPQTELVLIAAMQVWNENKMGLYNNIDLDTIESMSELVIEKYLSYSDNIKTSDSNFFDKYHLSSILYKYIGDTLRAYASQSILYIQNQDRLINNQNELCQDQVKSCRETQYTSTNAWARDTIRKFSVSK